MQGKATPQQLYHLEQTFTYNRNTDSISTIEKQVNAYEEMVKELAETNERTNFGIDKVERLQKEIDGIKEKSRQSLILQINITRYA